MEMIQISKKTWDELKLNPSYHDLLEEIEDREVLIESREKDENQPLKKWRDFKKENPL
ncbi:MAG: hypothetical protein OEV66_09620 [Spirochaetia bacterium]|nr:hypothetical protein [Spirochaetia bacterium]